MRRRRFLAVAASFAGCAPNDGATDSRLPAFLAEYQARHGLEPLGAARAWFLDARYGLFLQYGVYSQLGRGPTVQFDDRIPVSRYADLMRSFDPSGFDAEAIADLAVSAGMRYIGFPARQADGFCMFRTIETDFNSLEASGRDLVQELADACRARALGLLLSYAYAADWRHPYFFPAATAQLGWRGGRPGYDVRPPEYRFERDEDFLHYIRFAHNQLEEIAYRYAAVAGIRLEPLIGYYARPDLFPIGQTYAILREAQPGLLIGFGVGANGEEDFASAADEFRPIPAAAAAWQANQGKPLELRASLRPPAELPGKLEASRAAGANLLLVAQLAADGSFAPEDERTLRGFPRLLGA